MLLQKINLSCYSSHKIQLFQVLPGLISAKMKERIYARKCSNAVGHEKTEGLELEGRVATDEQGPHDRVRLVRMGVQVDQAVRMLQELAQGLLNRGHDT